MPEGFFPPQASITTVSQKIQFAQENGLEVTLASDELLEDLLVRSRGVGAVSSRGEPGRFHFPSFVASTSLDSVSSQSKFYLSTVTSSTGMFGSETGFGFLPSPVSRPCTSQIVDLCETIDLEDIPLVVLVQQEKLNKVKVQKKIADPCKLF